MCIQLESNILNTCVYSYTESNILTNMRLKSNKILISFHISNMERIIMSEKSFLRVRLVDPPETERQMVSFRNSQK